MKKIFYSMMAVALCACSQSDVDEVVTPPQPENKGVTFTVIDNGFQYEDGTRVAYGPYGSETAYKATFEEGDQIGVYAITSMGTDNTPAEYKFQNEPLTLGADGKWRSAKVLDLTDVKVLFAYAPYRADASVTGDYKPLFTGADGSWEVDNSNNRNAFFVGGNTYNITDNSGENFELNDWMGAAANVTAGQTAYTFEMKHMRGMFEVTTPKGVELTDLTLAVGSETGTQYHFTPYHFTANDKEVYRILTTEYRSTNTVYATIEDGKIVKKYKKTPTAENTNNQGTNGAGKCFRMNINYTFPKVIEVGEGKPTLAAALEAEYGDDYTTDATLTSLRLTGELQGCTENADGSITFAADSDWATLISLQNLKTLDMYNLTNTSIPNDWLKNAATLKTTLTTLILPNGLTTIGNDALQVGNEGKVANIDIPATVTEIGIGAFYWNTKTTMRIPEDSQLKTVGNGAFYNTKAVYTYDNNFSMLVLPETLTSIGTGGAFNAVAQLRTVVFKGETAPTIDNSSDAFDNRATIYVPNTTYKQTPGLFPGNTVFAGPVLTVDNYTAVYKDGTPSTSPYEGSLSALCDGPAQTYWHSDYDSIHEYDKWGIYIDITLPKAYSNLKLSYTTRWNGIAQVPKKVIIGVATDGDFTEAGVYDATTDATATVLPNVENTTKELAITATSSYKKVRFGVIVSAIGDTQNLAARPDGKVWTALSELTVYEDTWTE